MYLVAIIDWYSRRVLSWRLSNTLDTRFCLDALFAALEQGEPIIFNTDQGSQFTSEDFTGALLEKQILISMDGRGRALDNIFVERLWRTVKYEDIYLNDYGSVLELEKGLDKYFRFYNQERPYSALGGRTPFETHRTGGGGTRVDGGFIADMRRGDDPLCNDAGLESSRCAFVYSSVEDHYPRRTPQVEIFPDDFLEQISHRTHQSSRCHFSSPIFLPGKSCHPSTSPKHRLVRI